MVDFQRVGKLLAWFCFGLVLGGYSMSSFATVPMVTGYRCQGFTTYEPTKAAAASDWCTLNGTAASYCRYDATTDQCNQDFNKNGTWNSFLPIQTNSACPANSTSNGAGACTCNTGYTQFGSSCQKPTTCSGDQVLDGATNTCKCTAGRTSTGTVPANQSAGLVCGNGCEMIVQGADNQHAVNGVQVWYGSWSTTGNICAGGVPQTPSSPTDNRTDCPSGQVPQGTINGKTYCGPPTTDKPAKSTGTSSSSGTSTPSGGGTTSTGTQKQTTSTSCDGSTCTKDTTTQNADGSTSTKSDKQDQKSFCEQNPNLQLCKDSSFSDNACSAAPACTGDPVQCAQATQSWKIKCDMETEPTDSAYSLGKTVAGGGADSSPNPLDPSKVDTTAVDSVVANAAGNRTLTASCGASPSFSVAGHSYTLDTTLFCNFLSIIGYLMVAASTVIAIRMVASGNT